MNSSMPATGGLYLIVGYDGSDPAVRALDAAAALLRGRDGCLIVVYVPHMPSADMLTPEAVAGMTVTFDELARDLHAQASEQLRDREERWRFERAKDLYSDISVVLTGVAEKVRAAHPDDNVAIVVGSSSQARLRLVGSAAVSLARHAPVPLLIVP